MVPGDNYHNKAKGVTTSKLFCKVHVASDIRVDAIALRPRGGSGVV